MKDTANKRQLREQMLEAIESGKIAMRPKWYFMLRAALAALGVVIIFVALLYLTSLVIFMLRHNGVWFVPSFGSAGWYAFLVSLPWLLIVLVGIFMGILELLVRNYAFAYRRPLMYSALAILFIAVAGGLLVAKTSFHRRLLRYAEEDRLPFGGPFYRREFDQRRIRNVQRGVIRVIGKDGFIMESSRGEPLTVVITPRTRLPFGMDFGQGDIVVVFGERGEGGIRAFGIRKIEE